MNDKAERKFQEVPLFRKIYVISLYALNLDCGLTSMRRGAPWELKSFICHVIITVSV